MPTLRSGLNHPLRVSLAAEAHSRPFMRLAAPESLTHLAIYARESTSSHHSNIQRQHETLGALCAYFGVSAPAADAWYFFHDFGRFRLKWELHAEFATYTFAVSREAGMSLADAFLQVPLCHIPQEWMQSLQGKIMVAAHLVMDKQSEAIDVQDVSLRRVFEGNTLIASELMQRAEIYTDFLIQADNFSRFVVLDTGLRAQQPGRLAQRLLEIETYRMMALLGLPHAQRATPILNVIEDELTAVAVAMVDLDQASTADADDRKSNADKEQALLRRITALAARTEKLALDNNYRFSASRAYFQLVRARIEELRETRIEGVQTIAEFMDRRLAPAMNTCAATALRQQTLAERIANTNALLRTRVGIVQEHHNRKILESMNRRAALQLRLQQAVEGLSVVAISYYLAGLIGYVAKGAKAAGAPVNPDMLTGLLIPVIAAIVWLGLRRLHKGMHGANEKKNKNVAAPPASS